MLISGIEGGRTHYDGIWMFFGSESHFWSFGGVSGFEGRLGVFGCFSWFYRTFCRAEPIVKWYCISDCSSVHTRRYDLDSRHEKIVAVGTNPIFGRQLRPLPLSLSVAFSPCFFWPILWFDLCLFLSQTHLSHHLFITGLSFERIRSGDSIPEFSCLAFQLLFHVFGIWHGP